VSAGARELVGRRFRSRLTARAAILAVLVMVLGLFSVVPVRQYLEQRARVADLEEQARTLEAANDRLEAQIARLGDPDVIERLARECLGMVKSGEVAFVVVPKGGRTEPAPC
jgi:cell division protein FtsB